MGSNIVEKAEEVGKAPSRLLWKESNKASESSWKESKTLSQVNWSYVSGSEMQRRKFGVSGLGA